MDCEFQVWLPPQFAGLGGEWVVADRRIAAMYFVAGYSVRLVDRRKPAA